MVHQLWPLKHVEQPEVDLLLSGRGDLQRIGLPSQVLVLAAPVKDPLDRLGDVGFGVQVVPR